MHLDIQHIIHHYGYAGIAGALILEMIGIPFPGETLLTLAGIEWSKGTFSLIPLIIFTMAGNIVGSCVSYLIGRYLGRRVILKYGRLVGITRQRLKKAQEMFNKYQVTLLIFAKFIAGIRVLVAYLAGIDKMSFMKFSIYNAIGSFLWVTIFIVFGRYVEIGWERYHLILHQYMVPIVIVAALIALFFVFIKKRGRAKA